MKADSVVVPSMTTWATTVQAAVTAIRKAGATTQHILLPGNGYTSAGSFVSSGSAAALEKVTNLDGSTDLLIFDVHKYFDSDNSGTHAGCVSNYIDNSFKPLASYLTENKRQALLSEFGGGSSDSSCETGMCPPNFICRCRLYYWRTMLTLPTKMYAKLPTSSTRTQKRTLASSAGPPAPSTRTTCLVSHPPIPAPTNLCSQSASRANSRVEAARVIPLLPHLHQNPVPEAAALALLVLHHHPIPAAAAATLANPPPPNLLRQKPAALTLRRPRRLHHQQAPPTQAATYR